MTQSIFHVSSKPLIHENSKQANFSSHTRLAGWGLASKYDVCTHSQTQVRNHSKPATHDIN